MRSLFGAGFFPNSLLCGGHLCVWCWIFFPFSNIRKNSDTLLVVCLHLLRYFVVTIGTTNWDGVLYGDVGTNQRRRRRYKESLWWNGRFFGPKGSSIAKENASLNRGLRKPQWGIHLFCKTFLSSKWNRVTLGTLFKRHFRVILSHMG